jgi:hypothetical protein
VLAIPASVDPHQIDLDLAVDDQVPLALSHHGLDLEIPSRVKIDTMSLVLNHSIVVRPGRVLAEHAQLLRASRAGVGDVALQRITTWAVSSTPLSSR